MVLGDDPHPSPQRPRHGLKPSLQVLDKDLAWARMVLGKDLHSSRQGPRQGLTPEPAAS